MSRAASWLPRSLRGRFLLAMLLAAVAPLATVGWWLAHSGVNSAEALLQSQLDASVAGMSATVAERWVDVRGNLLLLAENEVASRTLASSTPPAASDSAYMRRLLASVAQDVESAQYRTRTGESRWVLADGGITSPRATRSAGEGDATGATRAVEPTLTVSLPVRTATGHAVGTLTARVRLSELLGAGLDRVSVYDGALGIFDARTGAAIVGSRETRTGRTTRRFAVGQQAWLASTAHVPAPGIDITLAAPTTSYIAPFQRAARVGFTALFAVAGVVILFGAFLTARLTRSLEEVADAASSIAAGDLRPNVRAGGGQEIERVAAAFNIMTENLRRLLGELSQRQALAAVGEFAASLAHEVRNALTAVRVDLQRVEEKLDRDSAVAPIVERALANTLRLDGTVTNALRLARSARVKVADLDLREVVGRAAAGAEPTLGAARAQLDVDLGEQELPIRGDSLALEQLTLNLLLNAAQAVRAGGRVDVSCSANDQSAQLVVTDDGVGIPIDDLQRVTDPFYSTKSDGTGLGLSIAKQIATAHHGSLQVESEPGRWTRVTLTLALRARPAVAVTDAG